jgi:hypothetical protein
MTDQFVGLHIGNRSSQEGAGEFARALLADDGIESLPMLLSDDLKEVTTIYCHPNREAEALELRDRFFPGAELRPRIDPRTLLVVIGDDFVRRHRDLFDLYTTVRSFMTRRVEGSGAEVFLSPVANDRFAEEASGLSLYSYVRGGSFQFQGLHPRSDGTAVVYVIIVTPESASYVASERLTVGDLNPADGRAEILDAEQISPPDPMLDQIRMFVRQFLRARREASGAGTYLGEDARAAFASHENGLDLLGYAARDELLGAHIVRFDKLSAERSLVQVRFSLPDRDIFERLTVERLGQTILVIADAERVNDGSER